MGIESKKSIPPVPGVHGPLLSILSKMKAVMK